MIFVYIGGGAGKPVRGFSAQYCGMTTALKEILWKNITAYQKSHISREHPMTLFCGKSGQENCELSVLVCAG
jgi:hypothetical protein